jgi:hypothetical protein
VSNDYIAQSQSKSTASREDYFGLSPADYYLFIGQYVGLSAEEAAIKFHDDRMREGQHLVVKT